MRWLMVVVLALMVTGVAYVAPKLSPEKQKEVDSEKLKREDPILWASQAHLHEKPWWHLLAITKDMSDEQALKFNRDHGPRLTKLVRDRVKHKDGWISVFEIDGMPGMHRESLAVVLFHVLSTDGDVGEVNWDEF